MTNKIAVQLYTLREECKQDFPAVLKKLADIGYGAVQFAGFHGYDRQLLKQLLDEYGMKTAGLHIGLSELLDETEKVVSDANFFETADLIVPSLPVSLHNEAGFIQVKQNLKTIASKLKTEGIRVSYHNHAFEFETLIDGVEALDYLLNPVDAGDVLAEIDVYWISKAGLDPLAYIQPYVNRMPIIHLKDMTKDEEATFAPLGTGTIDFIPILQWGEVSGVEWYVVEQDRCQLSPLESVEISYRNLASWLQSLSKEQECV